ncbi:DBD_Tnp_Mut domain-containing protein [Cephalotus follicularis]|uniref:DBD_Tnp_Mut domain-containing protein n=1 Tax=Cephalotus follicularis TaxID=3775 RepID=A0A1Q3C750_CEPFO|nr:DBD_Tnp_Mut domain-containing protein [Cephalotus follicularis]
MLFDSVKQFRQAITKYSVARRVEISMPINDSNRVQVKCIKGCPWFIGVFQFLSKQGSADVAGEIGVIFNIPQPFTVRTKRLSQVIRISHHHFKQMVQPHSEDGKKTISNYIQV